MNTKQKGDITELECITYFYKLGFDISIPYGENSRYDFIVDNGKDLLKIQCKTCQIKKDSIIVPCRSIRTNRKRNRVILYTKAEIDYFATFYNGRCYLIDVIENVNTKTLRFKPTEAVNQFGISLLEDYSLENVLKDYLLL